MPAFKVQGPFFKDPSTEVKKFLGIAREEIANVGVTMVKQRLGQVLKNPTGMYESRIQKERKSNGWWVSDSRMVYGPWLELGKSYRPTRFKGYRTFRIVNRELQGKVKEITQREVNILVNRLNG